MLVVEQWPTLVTPFTGATGVNGWTKKTEIQILQNSWCFFELALDRFFKFITKGLVF